MYSLLSQDKNRNLDADGVIRSIRILAQGLFILLLVVGVWWRQGVFIPLERYIQAVYFLLPLMAGFLIGVMIERSLRYWVARNQTRVFVREVAGALHDRNLDQAMTIAGRYRRSPSAKVVASGLARFQSAMPLLPDAEVVKATQRALKRTAALVHGEMQRGLTLLASVASSSPLVGALGTTLGISDSFGGCSGARSTCMAYYFAGLADALLLTALSLLLGVLTTWCYKYLNSELEAFDIEVENESAKLVNYLVVHPGRQERLPSV